MTDYWPFDLFELTEDRWTPRGAVINGGVTVGGIPTVGGFNGPGFWVGEQSFVATGSEQIKAARAIEAILDSGAGRMVAWSFETPFAPGDMVASLDPHSDGSPFGDDSLYLTAPDGAVLTSDAPLWATTLPIDLLSGPLIGGEHFSIEHPTKGRRRYRIKRVYDDSVVIWPPLREAAPSGTGLNFLLVGCLCRLINPEEFLSSLKGESAGDLMNITAKWVEAF